MTGPTTIGTNNPPATLGCGLNQPEKCRVKSDTAHRKPRPSRLTKRQGHPPISTMIGISPAATSLSELVRTRDTDTALSRLANARQLSQTRAHAKAHHFKGRCRRLQLRPELHSAYVLRFNLPDLDPRQIFGMAWKDCLRTVPNLGCDL